MFNIIFEIDFKKREERNIVFNINKDTITWKIIFDYLKNKLNISPKIMKLQIGNHFFRGDQQYFLSPLAYIHGNNEGNQGDFIIIKVSIINNPFYQ